MAWRLAKSLDTLRLQLNAAFPNRSKASDGTIGDTAHSARASDHNPNSAGVVQAFDCTHDPAHGLDAGKLVEELRLSKDPRIKYLIWNKRICASYPTGGHQAWAWRPYTGTNPHNKHAHISVVDTASLYDSAERWAFDGSQSVAPPPDLPDATKLRERMAFTIIGYEFTGPLKAYSPGDGSREIAGVNDRHHPELFHELNALVNAGREQEARNRAAGFVVDYTSPAAEWTKHGALEFYLRDCIYNRGPTGAAKILQRAVGVTIDGQVGPATKVAAAKLSSNDLLAALRKAREAYERTLQRGSGSNPNALRDESWEKWRGMVNRWDRAQADAALFKSIGMTVETVIIGTGTVIIGGGVAEAKRRDVDWGMVIPIALIAVALVVGIVMFIRARKRK